MEFKSTNIKNTKSNNKTTSFAEHKKSIIKQLNITQKILIGFIILAIVTIIIAICFFTNQNSNETINQKNETTEEENIISQSEYEDISNIESQIFNSEITEDEGEEKIDNFFNQKISTVSEDDYDSKALILAEKANTLISASKLEEANAIIEEISTYQNISWQTSSRICEVGMEIALEMDNRELFEKHSSKCDAIYEEYMGDESDGL